VNFGQAGQTREQDALWTSATYQTAFRVSFAGYLLALFNPTCFVLMVGFSLSLNSLMSSRR
jgi:hypothetical protein